MTVERPFKDRLEPADITHRRGAKDGTMIHPTVPDQKAKENKTFTILARPCYFTEIPRAELMKTTHAITIPAKGCDEKDQLHLILARSSVISFFMKRITRIFIFPKINYNHYFIAHTKIY